MVDRAEFVRGVLVKVLRADPERLWCLQKNTSARSYDLTCMSAVGYEGLLERCKEKAGEGLMAKFEASSLVRKSYKVVTVHMYNPYVEDEALEGFLAWYGRVLTGVRYLRDEFGIWTGKRQFRVDLREDPKGHDGLCHPPVFFSLGTDRGFLFYSEQPTYCRQCQAFGHTAANCGNVRCRNCNEEGHISTTFHKPRKCHGCGSIGHLFRDCPGTGRSYADAVGGSRSSASGGPPRKPGAAEGEKGPNPQPEKTQEEKETHVEEIGVEVATTESVEPAATGDEEGMEVAAEPERRQKTWRSRESESPEGGEASSGGEFMEQVKGTKKKKKKMARKGEDSQGVVGSLGPLPVPSRGDAGEAPSGLPPSGTVAVSNRYAVLQQDEVEVAGPSGAGSGDSVDREVMRCLGLGAEAKTGGRMLEDSSESEERCFQPPSSPNTSEFLSWDEGEYGLK